MIYLYFDHGVYLLDEDERTSLYQQITAVLLGYSDPVELK